MEIKKIVQNGHVYEFINQTWETYRAWGHDTTLFVDGIEKSHAHIRYYNRTWECYRYQTTMKSCVYSLLDRIENNFISDYKSDNNIKRLTKQKKQNAMDILSKNEKYQELRAVLNSL